MVMSSAFARRLLDFPRGKPTNCIQLFLIIYNNRIRHRGPDWSGCIISGNNIFCHERLAIVGVESGAQPILSKDEKLILTVNGEIYNYKVLKNKLLQDCTFVTYSDCEVIMHLYRKLGGEEFVKHLDGMFSFVLYDVEKNRFLAARDPIGITTLYYGFNSSNPETYYFASEMKCLNDICDTIRAFPPGHLYDSEKGTFVQWYQPSWGNEEVVPTTPVDYTAIRKTLVKAVKKRLMSEVPYGVLLSGGLDSSLIAAIAARETKKMLQHQLDDDADDGDCVAGASGRKVVNGSTSDGNSSGNSSSDEQTEAYWPRLHSFSIGLPDKFTQHSDRVHSSNSAVPSTVLWLCKHCTSVTVCT